MSRIPKPDGICFLGDKQGSLVRGDVTTCIDYTTIDGAPRRISFRHSNGCNIVFADGHAAWMSQQQVPTYLNDASAYNRHFWGRKDRFEYGYW